MGRLWARLILNLGGLLVVVFQAGGSHAQNAFDNEENRDVLVDQQFVTQDRLSSDLGFDGLSLSTQRRQGLEGEDALHVLDAQNTWDAPHCEIEPCFNLGPQKREFPVETFAKVPDIPFALSASHRSSLSRRELRLSVSLKLPFDLLWGQSSFALGPALAFNHLPSYEGTSRVLESPLFPPLSEPQRVELSAPRLSEVGAPRTIDSRSSGVLPSSPRAVHHAKDEQRQAEVRLRELRTKLFNQVERSSGLRSVQGRITSTVHRARLSGLTPEMRLRGVHGLDRTRSLEQSGGYYGDSTQRDGYDALLEVRLTFRLGRLLFAEQEPTLLRIQMQVLNQRKKLRLQVADALSNWVKANSRLALEKLAQLELHPEEVVELQHQLLEEELKLDLLSGGWFSRNSQEYASLLNANLIHSIRDQP